MKNGDDYIPAKPTEYRGVLFRSRLEARFAEYCDGINLKWVYEKRRSLRDYLCDFYLPTYDLWVEIKPKSLLKELQIFWKEINKLRRWICVDETERGEWTVVSRADSNKWTNVVGQSFKYCLKQIVWRFYLAGKINKNGWREDIAPYVHTASLDDNTDFKRILWNAIGPGLHYVGPYFVRCDHGCYHGPNRHGCWCDYEDCTSIHRSEVPINALEQIKRADIVFAWIEDRTAYGTLVEIGVAKAMGKQIWIGWPQRFDDLWFAASIATPMCVVCAPTAKQAFRYLLIRNDLIHTNEDQLDSEVSECGIELPELDPRQLE